MVGSNDAKFNDFATAVAAARETGALPATGQPLADASYSAVEPEPAQRDGRGAGNDSTNFLGRPLFQAVKEGRRCFWEKIRRLH